MSVVQKILVLVFAAVIATLGSFLINYAASLPAQEIRAEREVLALADDALLNLELLSADLFFEFFGPAVADFTEEYQKIDEVFDRLRDLRRIPALSEGSAIAVAGILNLHDQFTKITGQELLDRMEELRTQMLENSRTESTANNMRWIDYIGMSISPPITNDLPVRFALRQMRSAHTELKLSLETGRTVARGQFAIIDEEIEAVLARAQLITIVSIAGFVLVILLLTALFARRLTLPIRRMDGTVDAIAKGDLRPVFDVRSKDEIGRLGANLNQFTQGLRQTIGTILETSKRNLEVEGELSRSIQQASTASVEIDANIASITSQIQGIDKMVERALESFSLMERVIADTGKTVELQNSQHHEAAGTINRVLGAVQTTGELTTQTLESAKIMVQAASTGQAVFRQSHQKIAEITDSISSIRNLTKIISDISDRTNLLSMNAAIEAARAGESGRGFAVVANEIRNLATASAQSSQDISATIEEVIQRITEADQSRGDTEAAFDAINTKIQSASQAIEEMHRQIEQATKGSAEVLAVMRELDNSSRKSSEQAQRLTDGVSDFQGIIVQLQRVSSEVTANVGEISSGLGEIVAMVRQSSQAVETVGQLGKKLDTIVSQFTVE